MLKVKKKSDRICTFEFRDGIEVSLRYVSEHRFGQLAEQCTATKWRDHQPVKERDDDKYYQLCAVEMIAGWSGITGAGLKTLVDLEEYPEGDAEVPYSAEDAFVLLRYSAEFDVWATRNCKKLEAYIAAEEAKRKNGSLPMPASNSSHADDPAAENSLAESA